MRSTRSLRRFGATIVLTLFASPLLAAPITAPVAAGVAADYPLRKIGNLPEPATSVRDGAGAIASVDAKNRRMHYVYPHVDGFSHVITYDLKPKIPKPIADGQLVRPGNLFGTSPYSVANDTKRRQLTFITGNVDAADHNVVLGNPALTVYSDVSHKVSQRWDIATTIPGFFPFGITYSEKDDRLYVIGEFAGVKYVSAGTFTFGSKPAGTVTAIAALDPADGKMLWMRPMQECQQGLYTLGIGGLIARSDDRDALYVACVTGGTANGKTYPGQAGVIRLHINPKATTSAQAAEFPLDFYAISGNYFNGAMSGIAAFDRNTDRFYLQSLAPKTPGAWVFDGRLSAWVGLVSAFAPAARYIGLNESLGHLYMGTWQGGTPPGPTDGILVADVRQTPVPAGEFQPIVPGAFLATDAGSKRVFVLPYHASTSRAPYEIYEDMMPVTNGNVPVDYDTDTSDTPDTPKNDTFFALSAAGYGAHTVQVGGTGGAGSGPGLPTLPAPIPRVATGTRAAMSARSGGLDLRDSSATASSQAYVADLNTEQEYQEQRGEKWPFPETVCNDSGSAKVTETFRDDSPTGAGHGGSSTVTCDRDAAKASSIAAMGASTLGATTVQKSNYRSDAFRTRKDGAVVTTESRADGVTFDVAGGATVSFGHVVATSKSVAHGRPGTTFASWTRDVDGVRVKDATGKTLYAGSGCVSKVEVKSGTKPAVTDTCAELATSLNRVLQTRFRVSFPLPDAQATPKGAFATIKQTDGEFFQQRVMNDQGVIYQSDSVGPRPMPAMITEAYNDSTERSRTITALAATQSSAIFTVMPPFDYGSGTGGNGGNGGNGATGGTGTTGGTPGTPGTPGTGATGGGDTGGADGSGDTNGGAGGTAPGSTAIGGSELRGFLFMRRSVRDAALLVLLAGLMLGGLGTAWRRRRLVDVLVTVSGKGTS